MKQYLDSKGNPLEIGHEYSLVTYVDHNTSTPQHASKWIKAIWNGSSLKDAEGCTWTEWLQPAGEVAFDIVR